MKIIIDTGHGKNTPGKRSPIWSDGTQLLEWKYTREIATQLLHEINKLENGIHATLLVTEEEDIPLSERCRRANAIALREGANNCLLISIHVNASTNGKARGWEVHSYIGRSLADRYATIFWNNAKKLLESQSRMRADWSDHDPDFDSNFAILRDTICPAILTENLFMDNYCDCKFLLSSHGLKAIIDIHLNALIIIANQGIRSNNT